MAQKRWLLKKLLRSKANFDVLEGFLSELLKDDITIDQILESEGNKERMEIAERGGEKRSERASPNCIELAMLPSILPFILSSSILSLSSAIPF